MYEFSLVKSINPEDVYKKFDDALDKLAYFYSLDINDEHTKAIVAEKVYHELTASKMLEKDERLIEIQEVMISYTVVHWSATIFSFSVSIVLAGRKVSQPHQDN